MMRRDSVRGSLLVGAGVAMLASGILHGVVNVPHLREDMLEIGMRPTLLAAISLVLYFSVAAMFGFAALVLVSALSLLRGRLTSPTALWLIGATYVVFGVCAFVGIARNTHFLGYALMGLAVTVAALPPSKADLRSALSGR